MSTQSEMAAMEPDHCVDANADRIRDQLEAAYSDAARAAPQQCGTLHFALPGCDLEVRYAGRQVAEALTAAFEHRRGTSGEPGAMRLRWHIADGLLADALPILPEPPRPLHPFGSLHRNAENSVLVERRPGFVSALDVDALRVTTVANGLQSIDTDLAAKPLLRFLLPLLLRRGIVMCHAALVGGQEEGLLVTGQGGVGKSTISAAAVTAGAGFCSDDFVALQSTDAGLIGHCLFSTLMLTEPQMHRFPTLAANALRLRADVFGKYLVPLARHCGGQIRASMRVDAVAVPEIMAAPQSQLVPGKRSAMLRAITPSTLVASPWREAERTRFLFEHVSTLEPLIYRSGSDFARIADPLRERYGF